MEPGSKTLPPADAKDHSKVPGKTRLREWLDARRFLALVAAMTHLLKFLQFDFIPRSKDLALLLLRVWCGVSLFYLHGWQKLANFGDMSGNFVNFLGLGSRASLVLATVGETLCPLLVVLGLATRFGALGSAVTMGTAFVVAHDLKLQGAGNGELPFIFLAGFATIFLAGPGRFAFDRRFGGA